MAPAALVRVFAQCSCEARRARVSQADGGSSAPAPAGAAAAAQTSPAGSSVLLCCVLRLSGLRAQCPPSHRIWVVAHARLPSAAQCIISGFRMRTLFPLIYYSSLLSFSLTANTNQSTRVQVWVVVWKRTSPRACVSFSHRYQQILHRNLIYLATIADATPPRTQKPVD